MHNHRCLLDMPGRMHTRPVTDTLMLPDMAMLLDMLNSQQSSATRYDAPTLVLDMPMHRHWCLIC